MAKKKATLGCFFWLALILLVVVIFLFNQKNIEEVLKKTRFFDLFQNKEEPISVTIESDENPADLDTDSESGKPAEEVKPDTQNTVVLQVDPENPEEQKSDPDMRNVRNARIFYVSVESDGSFSLQSVTRPVQYDDSPLKQTIVSLLKGPSFNELNRGYLNLVPGGAALNRVYVKDGTAFVDFSEDFRFNTLGQVGLEAQLQQIVYTVTEFANIKNVQILIDGAYQKFLSPEGLSIAEPLDRSSFQ